MGYIVKIPLLVGTEVTEHTHVLARATLAVELGRPVGSVEYRGSTIADLDPLVVWHTFREVNE